MMSRQDIIKLLTLLLVASLFLVACERPLQNAGQTAEELATQVAQEAEQTGEGVEEADATSEPAPEEEAEEEEVTATEPAPTEEPALDDTPAPEDTVAPAEETQEGEEASPRTGGEDEEETETPEAGATEEGAGEATEEEAATEEPAAQETAEEATPEATAEEEVAEAEPEAEAEAETEEDTADEAAETTEEAEVETGAARIHVVQPGENLYRIGLRYGISWVVLADYNNISNPNSIFVGQELRIPPEEGEEQPAPTPTPSPSTETTYVVKPGDNLYRIGRAFNISWVQIAEANGIVNPNHIVVGQELKIPAEAPGPAPQFTHTVRQGETLFTISLRYGVPWSTIAEANDLTSPYVIYPGQTLVIPGG